jgi:hypothetical protein
MDYAVGGPCSVSHRWMTNTRSVRGVRHKSVDLDGVGAFDLDRFERITAKASCPTGALGMT